MHLTEEAPVPGESLPLAQLKAHLRLGSGFALAEDQDALLLSHLRAALAAIELRIAKALFRRDFTVTTERWRNADCEALPLAPVSAVSEVALVPQSGAALVVGAELYRLLPDQHRPKLAGTGAALPDPPGGSHIRIRFVAGFGEAWEDLPADLRQAVLLLAAEFYEYRHDGGLAGQGLPSQVAALIEPWRQLRVFGGGRSRRGGSDRGPG